MAAAKPQKLRRRYSIGEWYGVGFEKLTPHLWFEQAKTEIELAARDELARRPCPFQPNDLCSKKGGVCSLRLYEQAGSGPVSGVGPVITTCPLRFIEGQTIFEWVGKTLLQTEEPIVLGEVGFLDRLRRETGQNPDEEESRDFIGRIDNVLLHPTRSRLDWCTLELQAVYFSEASSSNAKALCE